MVGHSLDLYGHSQDPNVILCHLKSVPGESQASHRGDRLFHFWKGHWFSGQEKVWCGWSVSILSWFLCVNSFFVDNIVLLLFVFLVSLLFPINHSYLSPWSLSCVPLMLLSSHLWAEDRRGEVSEVSVALESQQGDRKGQEIEEYRS